MKAKEIRAKNKAGGTDLSCEYCNNPMRRKGDGEQRTYHDQQHGIVFYSGSLKPPENIQPNGHVVFGPVHLGRDGGESTCTKGYVFKLKRQGTLTSD